MLMNFREYIKNKFKSKSIIEFGPLNRPLFRKSENKKIFYADIRPTDSIKALYENNEYLKKTGIKVSIEDIVDIDYVVKDSYVATFKGKKFEAAYLSHVIEHMPNIIDFFLDINRVLTDDGYLVIIYPDKRYCFDHYRNSASFSDAYSVYKYGIKENARMAFDFCYNAVCENDPQFFWNSSELTSVINTSSLRDAEKFYSDMLEGNLMEDVHYWPFSDIDFLKFLYEMKRAGFLNFEVEEFHPTQRNTQEFMVILKKSFENDSSKILELIDKYDLEINKMKDKHLISKLEDDLENAKCDYIKTVEEKEGQITKLSDENKSLQGRIVTLQDNIEAINNSKSMKVTKPLRVLGEFLHRKKGSEKNE